MVILTMAHEQNGRDHWFEDLADHLGPAYLRYSFTYGTDQEVDFLVEQLGLAPGTRVLDVGCGPGRHARALAQRGIVVHGVDISQRFVDLARDGAPDGATFERMDARAMPFDAEFDLVLSLCQGAFGLPANPAGSGTGTGRHGDPEPDVLLADLPLLERMAAACRPGGRVVLSAFSAYFQVRHLSDGPGPEQPLRAGEHRFDAATGAPRSGTRTGRWPRSTCGRPATRRGSCGCWPRPWASRPRRCGRSPPAATRRDRPISSTRSSSSSPAAPVPPRSVRPRVSVRAARRAERAAGARTGGAG
jgi:SAM-dependent methyltransferase